MLQNLTSKISKNRITQSAFDCQMSKIL